MRHNNDYWKRRFEAVAQEVYDTEYQYLKELTIQYKKAATAINSDIRNWFLRFAKDNQLSYADAVKVLTFREREEFQWELSEYARIAKEKGLSEQWQNMLKNYSIKLQIDRLVMLNLQISQELEILFKTQNELCTSCFTEIFKDSYYHTAFEIQRGLGYGENFNRLNTNKIQAVLEHPWATDGKNFSSRVWEHKDQLIDTLKNELTQAVIRGEDYRKATDNVSKRLNVSKSAARRIVMTESTYFSSKAQNECYQKLEVDRFQFIATLDYKTSEVCQEHDGNVYPVSEFRPGVNAPPLHPHCRSCTAPYFPDDSGSVRVARGRDGERYYVPANITYKEWFKKAVTDK